ncbi:MAG TPA: ATP-dependent Clp protease proteolytic subunit [Devosia sp.]|nr:ATP-dependent Clp protease proteolytic subunit [Devosia sp.]
MERLIHVLGVALALALLAAPAFAMTFTVATTSRGYHVVVAKGDIARGDAKRLARALEKADRDRHGMKQLYLESKGGLVYDALAMAEVMQEVGVSTIVRKDTVCASACASVLFVAGKYRTVEKGGLLAIHSCYDNRNGRAASECNAVISAQAEASGVSALTMMALQEAAGRDSVIVFEADDAACFGLTLKPGAKPRKGLAPCVKQARQR